MPYSIFFTMRATPSTAPSTAISATPRRTAACGCRCNNAAKLWDLVKHKMAHTTVVLNGKMPGGEPPAVARSRPLPLTPEEPFTEAPVPLSADNPSYETRSPQYQPQSLLPFPFFFGR